MRKRQTDMGKTKKKRAIGIALIVVAALVTRTAGLSSKELWYDELQSATHAYLPLGELVKSVQRFDPHPPFYYVQLGFWMLFGVSDLWIKLNSVLWSVLTVVSLFVVGRNIFSDKASYIASILFIVSPFSVAYAQEARMYSLLMFLGLWALFFTHHFLYSSQTLWMGGGIVVTTLAFLYSHGAGFMIVFSVSSYALMYLFGDNRNKGKRFFRWIFLQVLIVALYVPWLKQAQTINVGHTLKPDLEAILTTLSQLFFGFGSFPNWAGWIGVVLATGLCFALLVGDQASRRVIIAFVLVPVIVCGLISYLIRPIWLQRTLAYTAPFLILVVARAISKSFDVVRSPNNLLPYGFFITVGLVLFLALINQQSTFSNPWKFKKAAAFIEKRAQPGDTIYVPHERVFWGFSWYFIGPGSVDPLSTDYSVITSSGVRLLAKNAFETCGLEKSAGYWLVYRDVFDSVAPFEPHSPEISRDFDYLFVEFLHADLDR